jgi:hypothetical protein
VSGVGSHLEFRQGPGLGSVVCGALQSPGFGSVSYLSFHRLGLERGRVSASCDGCLHGDELPESCVLAESRGEGVEEVIGGTPRLVGGLETEREANVVEAAMA